MCSTMYVFTLVFLLTATALSETKVILDYTSSIKQEQSDRLEELARKDPLASIIWKITDKYYTFNVNNTNDECLEIIDDDHTLVSPYLVSITLNESKTFMEKFTEKEFDHPEGNELQHAYNLYEKHTKILQDQDEYFTAVNKVSEKLEKSFNDSFLCPLNSTCGCVEIVILENYETELARFRENKYALWEYTIFGTYVNPIFRIFMILIGLVLNITIVYIFIKEKSTRRESNCMIFNLVLNHILILLVYIPKHYLFMFHRRSLSNRLAFYLIQIIVISVSATTVLILNIQRYVDVSRILTPAVGVSKIGSRGRIFAYVTTVWIWTIIITTLIGHAEVDDIVAFELALYLVMYVLIYSILHSVFSLLASRKLQHAAERGLISDELQYITSSSVSVSLIMAFYVLHLPYFVFLAIAESEEEGGILYFLPTVPRVFNFVFHLFLFSYPSVNAIIIYKTSSEFRRYFQKYLCRCWYKGDDGVYLTMSSLQSADAQQ